MTPKFNKVEVLVKGNSVETNREEFFKCDLELSGNFLIVKILDKTDSITFKVYNLNDIKAYKAWVLE